MKPIQVKFPDGKTQSFLSPTGFEDISEENYIKVMRLMKRSEEQPSAQWMLVMLLMKMPVQTLKALNAVQRVELLGQLEFLYDLDKLPSKCMIKKISARTKTKGLISLHGPGDAIKHLTFGEFMKAETKLERYETSGNGQELNQLCGVLYRPADKSRTEFADKRLPYQQGLVEFYGNYFQTVDPEIKTAVLMNYHGMKATLPKIFPNVFPAPLQNQDQEPAKQKKPKKSQALSWLQLLSSMADLDVTRYPAIESLSLHTVLFNLNQTIERNENAKNEMARLKNTR